MGAVNYFKAEDRNEEGRSLFCIGLAAAFAGVLLSDVFADILNGLPYGNGAILGMGAYPCAVVITCTGMIISKPDDKAEK